MRILVVDDEPLNLRLVEAAVTRLGHQATAAADGEAAWQCYNQDPPEDEEIGRFKYSHVGQLSVANPSPEECNTAVDQQPADKLRVREGLRFCVRTAEGLIGFLEVAHVSGAS
jgi:CheY-like chemotaxis protein